MAFPSIQPSLSLAQGMHFLSNFARPCTLLQIYHCFNRSGMAQSDKHRLHDPRDPGSIPTTGSTVFFFYSPMVMTIIRESRLFCSEFWVDYRWHQWQAEWKLHFIDMNNAPSWHFAYSRLKLLFQLWGLRELDKWLFIGIFFWLHIYTTARNTWDIGHTSWNPDPWCKSAPKATQNNKFWEDTRHNVLSECPAPGGARGQDPFRNGERASPKTALQMKSSWQI